MCCTYDPRNDGQFGWGRDRLCRICRERFPAIGASVAEQRSLNRAGKNVPDVKRRGNKMCQNHCVSPCEGCTRVANPKGCENKNCKEWKAWFLRRWAVIYAYGRKYGQK